MQGYLLLLTIYMVKVSMHACMLACLMGSPSLQQVEADNYLIQTRGHNNDS